MQLNRNNTNFTLQLFEYFKKTKWESKYDFLKYYQNIARMFVTDIDVNTRGLLFYHGMGLGKSILAISIAMDLMKERQPIILLTKSLVENMRGAIHKYVRLRAGADPDYALGRLSAAELDDWIAHNFSFVSMNASNMLKQMGKAAEGKGMEEFDAVLDGNLGEVLKLSSLDGKLLIVDEAHNLFRAITNGSKNALGLYNMIMKSKNLRVMFFTGTPSSTDPFELVPCFNMLGASLPEDYTDFNRLYVDRENGRIINKEKFQNRLLGMVSYVSHASRPGPAFADRGTPGAAAEFPEQLPLIVERVPMTQNQYVMYSLARDKEMSEGSRRGGPRVARTAPMTKPKSGSSSTYRVRSRQLSNYCAPESPKFEKIYENFKKHLKGLDGIGKNKVSGGLGIVYSQFVASGIGTFATFLKDHGWRQWGEKSGGDTTDEQTDESTNDESTNEKVETIKPSVTKIVRPSNSANSSAPTFAVISGEVDVHERKIIEDAYNTKENEHGANIAIILLSSTGAEGLDFKNIRHVHIMEPYWTWSRSLQIIARGVRNDSHKGLPPEEKNVQPYIYLAVPPVSEESDTKSTDRSKRLSDREPSTILTTDVELYEESLIENKLNDSFMMALREISIECLVNNEDYCRLCNPTNQPLFTADYNMDVKRSDPCTVVREESIAGVYQIEYNGKTYYYKKDDKNVFGYLVFVFDANLDAYRPLPESPLYVEIADAAGQLEAGKPGKVKGGNPMFALPW